MDQKENLFFLNNGPDKIFNAQKYWTAWNFKRLKFPVPGQYISTGSQRE